MTAQDQLQEILQKAMADILFQTPGIFLLFPEVLLLEQLTTSFDEKYISGEELKIGEEKCELVFKLINGYIAYLDKSKKQTVQQSNQNLNS